MEKTQLDWNKNYGESREKVERWRHRGEAILEALFQSAEGKHVIELLRKGCRVLDIGSGEGYNSLYLAERYPVKTLGMDVSVDAVQRAKTCAEEKHLSESEFIVGDLRDATCMTEVANMLGNDVDKIGIAIDFRATQFLSDAEKDDFLNRISEMIIENGYYILEAFVPTEENRAAALTQEDVRRMYGRFFATVDTIPMNGTQVYVMKKEVAIE